MVAVAVQTTAVFPNKGFGSTTPLIDLHTFNNLVLEHQDAVYRQAYWILNDPAAAEDAAQEAFLRAYRNIDRYNGGPFLPWVLRITTNYCLDQLRRRKFRKTIPLEPVDEYDEEIESPAWLRDPDASVEEMVERGQTNDHIMQCIQRLPPDYRAAVLLVDVQELDYAQAASVLGICIGTFKSRLARARAMLHRTVSLN
jgi:RNA polymerase sigma-70 factor (ECF subfamily)